MLASVDMYLLHQPTPCFPSLIDVSAYTIECHAERFAFAVPVAWQKSKLNMPNETNSWVTSHLNLRVSEFLEVWPA